MRTKKERKKRFYFSKVMMAFIITPIVSIIETIVILNKGELETLMPIIGLCFLDIVIAAISIWAIITINNRNRENGNNRQPSGKSRLALDISGWLLVALATKEVLLCLFYLI